VVPLSDVGYWAQYYSLFNSAADVYSLISVQDGTSTLHLIRELHKAPR
jgi:hypothetical protein